MSAPQSSSSDLAWVPAPRDIRPDEVALVRARVERVAVDAGERDLFLSMIGLEVAS